VSPVLRKADAAGHPCRFQNLTRRPFRRVPPPVIEVCYVARPRPPGEAQMRKINLVAAIASMLADVVAPCARPRCLASEDDWNGARFLQKRGRGRCGICNNNVRLERDEFLCESLYRLGIARGSPASVDPDVATPIRRTRSACYACAASGNTRAALPSNVINSRRRMSFVLRPRTAPYHIVGRELCCAVRQNEPAYVAVGSDSENLVSSITSPLHPK